MKQLSIIILAFAAFWLAGCTVEETNNDNPVNKDGNAHLKVTFSNGTQSRAIGDPFAAELAEKTINRLSFYVYPTKKADKEMVPFQRYVFDMTTMPLTKDSVSIAYANGMDAGGGYTCDFILREGAGFECTIVAIANAPDNFDRTNNLDTYAKLQQAYVDCENMPNTPEADLTSSNRPDKYGLAMYAEDTKMIKKALTTNVVFDMERLAARIDISNAAYEETEANGFVLQSARIINGKHTSYVIPATVEPWTHPGLTTNFDAVTSDANPNAFRLATKTGTVSDANTTDANGNPIITDDKMDAGKIEQRLWHALYTYENDDEEAATATSIEIKGLFRGAPFSRILPFVNYDKNPVVIQRNHRYLVRLNPAASLTDITYNITVAEWNAVDTINVKPTQKEVPTLIYKPEYTPVNKTLEILNKNASFTLDAVCQFDTQAKVVPEVGDDPGTDVSWVKVTASEPEVVTRTTGYKRTYTVTATDITDDQPRQAMLLIANGANFTARDTVHIKQVMAQGKPTVTYTKKFTPDASNTLTFFREARSFTLDAACPFDTHCNVVSGANWIQVTRSNPDASANNKRTYTIQIANMPSGTRTAELRICNDYNANEYETLIIKQIIYIYPGTNLEPILYKDQYWAPVNAGATRIVYSISSYDVNTCGLLYQWGKREGQKYGGEPNDVRDSNYSYSSWWYEPYFYKGLSNHQGSWFYDNKAPDLSSYLHVGDNSWNVSRDPCPDGWRVPTGDELRKITDASLHLSNGVAVIPNTNNKFVLPAAGYRESDTGNSAGVNADANYWSSTLSSSGMSPRSCIHNHDAFVGEAPLACGFSVRCIQE